MQVPAWQLSACVQAFPSLQTAPSGWLGVEQAPVVVLQVPATWHWSLALHTTGLVPVHVPAWQLSACVQAFPSLQAAPSALLGVEQAPVAVSQVPATWH